jgi:hypothetical protein
MDESLHTIGNINGLCSLGLNGCKDITDEGAHAIIVDAFVLIIAPAACSLTSRQVTAQLPRDID